ncbi:hypothetical protein K6119_18950 [Paracrocinitomix mangrovi]|uniref:hypothetical protein n=1 Tax=Paracrocinitomix mangrovi TaxID=2862509 RepID=UPI001C8DEBEC|nr:hypothetical protein [Paracrocinitomix mangrovi]UKN01804.1 hypothetical protein K6119_18950 [Paracrocinitomix mangrovi]
MKHWVYILIPVLFFSCKKNDNTIIYGYEYFPVDSGHYVVYDVIDILHDDAVGVHDTTYYQIKEVIGEEDLDLENETFNKLYRYQRFSDTLAWQLKDVWVVKKTNTNVEVVEENERIIKMAFSISYDQYWDRNALNNNPAQQCYYNEIYKPATIGAIDYDSTVIVEHQDFSSYIEYDREFEVYARNVGRVQLVRKHIDIFNGDTLQVDKGTELFYTAVDFGG